VNKVCPTCKQPKTVEELISNGKYCKKCWSIRNSQWRAKNVEKNKECQKAYGKTRDFKSVNRRRREKAALIVLEYLLCHPCVDCGDPDPLVLDFDHIDRSEKTESISAMIVGATVGTERLQKEMAKCDVRCSNCHRRKHAKERNILRYQLLQKIMDGHLLVQEV